MTLCIAEKAGQTITFAADSRIGLGDEGHVDIGVKILRVPVVVRSPSNESGNSSELYNHTLGLGIVGSALNSYLVKETVCEILQNLQFAGFDPNFSFDNLARYVKNVFEEFSNELCSHMMNRGKAQLVLGGYCPAHEKIRVFFFDLDTDLSREKPLFATMTEILADSGIEFYGSGKTKAKELYAKGTTASFEVLKAVIDDPSVPSVGGAIQAGIFIDKDFKIKVIEDYLLTDNGIFKMRHALRGVNLYDYDGMINGGLVPSYEFLAPFRMKMLAAARAARPHQPKFELFKKEQEKEKERKG